MAKIDPNKKFVYESGYCDCCYYQSIANINDIAEVCEGGTRDNELWNFLVKWRVWGNNPNIKTILDTPWLTHEQVLQYVGHFITDKKVKKFFLKYNTFPSIQDAGFKHYFDK